MKKYHNQDGNMVLALSWKDVATLLPEEVSKKVAEYAGENVTPTIIVQTSTGSYTSILPLFCNVKHDPNATSPTIQVVSDKVKADLKAKGLITWKDAEEMVSNRRLFHELIKLGVIKYKEVNGVLFTIPESVIVALNSFTEKIKVAE